VLITKVGGVLIEGKRLSKEEEEEGMKETKENRGSLA